MRMALPILIFVYKVVIMKVKTNAEITEFLSKIGEPMGITVVETEFKQGKNPSLTVYIDKEGGIDLDTCEAFHRAIDQPIDELDPTFGLPYTLNVSSLGIDRPFKTDKDFIRFLTDNAILFVNLVSLLFGVAEKLTDEALCFCLNFVNIDF